MTRKTPSSPELGGGKKALALLIGKLCGIAAVSNASYAGPAGGVVTAGEGAISTPTTTSTVIDQASNRLSIDWQSFDVAANESVRFNQPTSNSVALNRILDQKPSEVFGRIDANGRIVLFNSNGIMFGPGSQVNVGSLLATSLNVVSFDDATGQLRLQALGSPGSIVNSGTLTAAPGGSVSLVGGSVSNNGHIVADLGSVNLAAGRAATLDFYGGGLLRFEADSSLLDNPSGAAAGVNNAGTISAAGGQVLLTTSAAQNVFSRAVNNDGVVSATRIENVGGAIRLVGAGGTVVNSGVLDASGVGAGSTGGSVQVLGQNVGLFGNARVDVSGDAGGGVALIGGDFQGANPDVLNADRTIVGSHAQIHADARVSGDGGRVIVWSDDLTRYYGSISARGGAESGNGGFAEISGHATLDFNGLVNLGAPAGVGGTLLLDPEDLAVEDGGPETDVDYADFDDSPTNASIDADAVVAALEAGAAVNLLASDDITINEAIIAADAPPSGPGMTLRAGDNVFINQPITTGNRNVSITAADDAATVESQDGDGTGDVTFAAGAHLNAGTATVTIASEGNDEAGVGGITSAGGVITAASLSVDGAVVNLNTTIGTLTSGIATGSLTISNTSNSTHPALTVSNASGAGVNISTNDNLTVGMVSATGTATLTSTAGSILDDGAATAITAPNIVLSADDAIGSIIDLRAGTGSAVDINSVNPTDTLSVSVTQANGDINLEFADQIPVIAAGGIDLGGANPATGRILLQTAGDFDVAPLDDEAIDNDGGSAQIALRSGGLLTLPTNTNRIFETAPGTLMVTGSNIVDGDGGPITFNVPNLVFDTGATSVNHTLNVDVDTLASSIGNVGSLTVTDSDDINLVSVVANDVNATATGTLTVGTVTATGDVNLTTLGADNDIMLGTVTAVGDTVTLEATGDIRDGAPSTPSVVADQLTIDAADSVILDTDVSTLVATSGGGVLTIADQNSGLAVTTATTTGGPIDISTTGGTLAATNVSAGSSTAALTSTGGALTLGTVTAFGGVNLTTTGVGNGITLGTVNAGVNTATFSAGGAISDNTLSATPSVTAGTLTITTASGANLDTDVNNLNASVGAGGLDIRDQNTGLGVGTVTSAGAVALSSTGGAMTVTSVNAGANTATLTATGGAMTLGTVTATGGVSLTATGVGNGITLGSVNAGAGTATLSAGGAISDAVGTTPSVAANQLTITTATSADLDTDVNSLTASIGGGALAIRDQNTGLAVTNANSGGGTVNISTTGGTLAVTTVDAGASTATLTSTAGAMTLGTVTGTGGVTLTTTGVDNGITLGSVNAGGATATLSAGGAIGDAAGTTPSITANQLTITTASGANLDTDVNVLQASVGGGGLTIRDQNAGLTVTGATATSAIDISTAGTLTVAAVNAGASTATLTATNGAMTVGLGVNGVTAAGGISLTTTGAGNDITLGTLTTNATTGTVTLVAGGDISDALNAVPSVVGGTLTITDADSVDLDTNVATLNASGVTGPLTVRDQVGALQVNNAVSTGAVDISTPTGDLNVTNASGTTVTLSAGTAPAVPGTLSATTVNATAGAANLTSNGTMTVGNVTGVGATLTASGATGDLTVTGTVNSGAGAASLNASRALAAGNVTAGTAATLTAGTTLTANAVNVTGPGGAAILTSGGAMTPTSITTNNGNVTLNAIGAGAEITLAAINAGTGNVSVTAANGSITDDDDGTATTTQVIGNDITLTAATNIGTVTTFETALGRSVDVLASGQLVADVTTNVAGPVGGQINLNIAGAPDIDLNGIRLGDTGTSNRIGRVLLQSAGDLDLGLLTPGAINIGASNSASVGYVSGGDLTLPVDSLTDTAPLDLLIAGADVFNSLGDREIGLSADTAVFNASAAGGDFTLNTSVGTLHSNVGTVGLTVNEALGDITLGGITASNLTVNANTAGGSILDDGNDATVVNAGTITLDTTNMIGGGLGALDVNTGNLVATVDNGTINLNSVGTGPIQVDVTSFGDEVTLVAAGDVGVTNLSGSGVNLNAAGAITDAAGPAPSVVATQLTITGAASADLDTNVNLLTASGVTGALNIREQTGGLAVTNATAGTVNVSTVAGALTVTNATSSTGAVTLAAGGAGNDLTVTNASGNGANLTAGGDIVLGTVNAGAGTATLSAGSTITDGVGNAPSVIANQLTIAGATFVNLDTDVSSLTSNGVAGILAIREQAGDLALAGANADFVDVTAVAGSLTNVNSNALNNIVLTASNNITLGTVNSFLGGPVTLTAGGAISDAAGATPSVVGDQLTIAGATSVDLDTNVNTLAATGIGAGGLTVREQTGNLAVTNAASAGAVNVSTVAGALNVANATGNGVTLSAGGAASDLAVTGTVNAGAGTAALSAGRAIALGTVSAAGVTLAAGGQISDAGVTSVVADDLTITGASAAYLNTDVNTLNASGVTGDLVVREESGALAVTNASAGGVVDVSTVDGALTVANASGNGVGLIAGGLTSDLTVTGTVNAGTGSADLTAGRAMTLGTVNGGSATLVSNGALTLGNVNVTGTATMLTGGNAITDAAGTAPSVTGGQLQILNAGTVNLDTAVSSLDAAVAGDLIIRQQGSDLSVANASAIGDVDVSNTGGALTNVNAAGANVTLTASTGIQIDIVDACCGTATLTAGGAITDTVDGNAAVVANQLTIASAGSVDLETDINTLTASNVAGDLTVQERTGALTVTNASAAGAVNVSTVAGALNVTNANGNGVTLAAGGLGGNLVTGTVDAGAGAATMTANGLATLGAVTGASAVLTAGGNLTLSTVNTGTGTTTLASGGAIADGAGATPSITAGELAITNAGSVDLDTNVNSLNANNVGNALMVREQTGGLAVTNANAGGDVWLSTVDGALTNVNASGLNVNLVAGGAGNGISLGTVTAASGNVDLTATGAITDAAGTAPSVVANDLFIAAGAASVDLDTNVSTLFANNVAGALTVREANALAVDSATSGGNLSISTTNGNLTVTNAASTNGSLTLAAGGAGSALNVTTASGTGATLTSGGAMTIANNTLNAGTGAATLTAGTTMQLGTVNAASATLTSGGAMSFGTLNLGTGTASLTAGGAITDAAGATPSIVASQLTIAGAGSVDLDTNVNTLNASGVTGALNVREQTGALAVTNASSTGAVNVQTVAGALNVTAASGNGVTLIAGGAGSTLTTTGTVAAGAGAATLTSGGAMELATVNAGSATLTSGGAITLGSVNAGTGNASLTATGAITDGTSGTGLTAGAASLTAASIGTAGNTFNTSVSSLTATTSGSMYVREANDISLTNLSATTAGQDIVVGALGNITVNQVSNPNGRVLLAAADDILATDGSHDHITTRSVELRAGLVPGGGAIGSSNDPLRLNVPETVGGGGDGTGAPVPSVLLVQNESAPNSSEAQFSEQLDLPGTFNISTTTFDRGRVDANAFLTTTFSTRSVQADGVEVQNAAFNVNGALNTSAQVGLSTRGAAAVLSASGASNAQGEGTLYIDWASFDPNVSLFGTVNPPICLPADQSDEDTGDAAAASSGCAATTAQYDGSFRLPEVKLVITSRGVEWVTTRTGQVTVFPLIGQIR